MSDHIINAKCVDKCIDSKNVVQYLSGDVCEFNVTTGKVTRFDGVFPFDRQLFYLKTLGGKWVFVFDRAESSNTALRLFFCAQCGQPFEKLNEYGTHIRSVHNKTKALVGKTHAENDDEEEEQLLAARIAEEQAEMLENAIEAQKGDKEMAGR